jgi:hypothetical protein
MTPRLFATCTVLVVAASLTIGAPSARGTEELTLHFVMFTATGTPVRGRAQLVTPAKLDALVAQARAGTLRRIELQVGPGPLGDALRRAREDGSRFRLTADVRDPEAETYLTVKFENVLVSSYQSGGGGLSRDSARVGIVPGQVEVTPLAAGRPTGAPGSLQTPGGPPVLPGKRPGAGNPDQGLVAPPLPDLEIRKVAPAPGAPNALAVTVRNDGVGPAGATQLKLYVPADGGKVLTAQAPVPALAAGQSTEVKIGVGGQPIVEANLRVDDPNVVGETDELNNGFHYTAEK